MPTIMIVKKPGPNRVVSTLLGEAQGGHKAMEILAEVSDSKRNYPGLNLA